MTYTFDVPVDQGIVIAKEANKVVLASYCMRITTPSTEYGECYSEGGGGGDGPVSTTFIIPAINVPDARQTVELPLTRPLDSLASYQLTAYPITPRILVLGQSILTNPVTSQPYQLYALDTEPNQSFTVQVEDGSVEGDFLWVAAYPPFLGEFVTLSEERQLFPQNLDFASREHNPDGITRLQLYYLGGNSFRVFVEATGCAAGRVRQYRLHAHAVLFEYLPPTCQTPTRKTDCQRPQVICSSGPLVQFG
jgi:hypothetical protein